MEDININEFFHSASSQPEGPISPGQKRVPVKWHFKEGTKDQIEYVNPGCWCTEDPEVTEEGIKVYYNNNNTEAEIKGSPDNRKTLTKTVKVYFKDGKPLKVQGGMSGKVYNPEKTQMTLFFAVTVKV